MIRMLVFALLQCRMRACYWSEVLARMIRTPYGARQMQARIKVGPCRPMRTRTLEVGIVHEGREGRSTSVPGQQLGLSASCTSAIPGRGRVEVMRHVLYVVSASAGTVALPDRQARTPNMGCAVVRVARYSQSVSQVVKSVSHDQTSPPRPPRRQGGSPIPVG